jgi:hypothetical protein
MSALTVVALGPEGDGASAPPAGLVSDWIAVEDLAGPSALDAIASRASVLWLPAWARLSNEDWRAVRSWYAGAAPTARARLKVARASSVAAAGRALVLSRPGTAGLRRGVPTASTGGGVDLPGRWILFPPPGLSDYLQGVNRQTSAAVRVSSECDGAPHLGALLRPIAALPLRFAAGSGPARERFSPSVLEAYRAVLLAAKSWERRYAPPMERA